ncbi:MAG: MFS transporter, partial [archaeon GBS-70-058]|nr:MFS transporter [Candidatus Culexarchaeum nevadense]
WVYGAILSLLFPYLLLPKFGWRNTFLVSLIPLSLIPPIILFIPESLRYLQFKGEINTALNLLKKHNLIPRDVEFKSVFEKYTAKSYRVSEALMKLWSKNYWKRTLMLWILWASLVYTYHGIFIWLPAIYVKEFGFTVVKSIEWTLIVTLAQIPGYYSAALMLDHVGRKPIEVLYLFAAGFGSFMLSLSRDPTSILICSIIISFFNLGAWSALYAYTPELYPTEIRGTGSGAAASIGRIAGIIAPTATPLIYAYWGLNAAFIVFASIHFLGALATLILGFETKGRILEELAN